jgi:hypothetical protein
MISPAKLKQINWDITEPLRILQAKEKERRKRGTAIM